MNMVFLPIENMCGYKVGFARVTINKIGNYVIDPLGKSRDTNNMGLVDDYRGKRIHLGMWRKQKNNKSTPSTGK